jgi:hypothetical protein
MYNNVNEISDNILDDDIIPFYYHKGKYRTRGIKASDLKLYSASAKSLSETLTVGNTTGGTSIITSNEDSLQAANGGGYLNLRAYDTDNNVLLTTDDENYLESGIEMYPDSVGIWANGYKASLGMGSISAATDPNDSYTYLLSNKAMIQIRDDYSGGSPITNGIYIVDPNPTTGFTAPNTDSLPATICSRNSTLNNTVRNSVALGGTGLTVAANNTVYMQNVNIVGTITVDGSAGFNGTGAYTNFTIIDGIITSAS